mmetsp:Transcript_38786/g.74441  ORF Transcript_38786/g.74441 Transcript_38786/m.74441 type:complete len:130 (+) Transcript_38786:73-462(+)
MTTGIPAAAAAAVAASEVTMSKGSMEFSGSVGAPGPQWHHIAHEARGCKDDEEETECTMSSSGAVEHFELANSDMECMDLGGVNCTSLLPVTTGSSRTAKRRFRRQRTRQKHRMLQQFPQLAVHELQQW